MQGKGLITAFGSIIALICLYQLSLNFFVSNTESKADKHAQSKIGNVTDETQKKTETERFRRAYLDSVGNKSIIPGVSYDYAKAHQLNLGLDLQGGMSVVLQVSMEDLVRRMANGSTDPSFVKALADAKKAQQSSDRDFVTLFGEAYQAANPNGKLASLFATSENSGKVALNASNDEVLNVIRQESDAAFDRTLQIIRTRVDKFGVASPNINAQKGAGRIVVELPGANEPERVRKLLQATAQLEFWEMYTSSNEIGN
ncbi:MAG TPA: protein translocase subunit SecDF, partial [Chitinophagales bacterium]|nr:protein translocase subunit SecDF [Chitinophagales bacterium]